MTVLSKDIVKGALFICMGVAFFFIQYQYRLYGERPNTVLCMLDDDDDDDDDAVNCENDDTVMMMMCSDRTNERTNDR